MCIRDREYTMVELNVAIEKLKTKKSPGSDKIHAKFIKNLGPVSYTHLDVYKRQHTTCVRYEDGDVCQRQ